MIRLDQSTELLYKGRYARVAVDIADDSKAVIDTPLLDAMMMLEPVEAVAKI